jgi:hypothetical protein
MPLPPEGEKVKIKVTGVCIRLGMELMRNYPGVDSGEIRYKFSISSL